MPHDTSSTTQAYSDEALTPDVVDDEDTSRDNADVQPWDPSKIRITTKHFSLRDVVDQIREEEVDLSPDFQRDYVWKQRQRTRLIESILLGIPLPAFYFNQDSRGTYQVVDGVQRLSTISLFMNDGHPLDKIDLEYLHNLHGLTYSQLDPAALRRFRSTQIVVHVIEPQTPDEVKYDIFGRVNTLGSPLSAQEIRHAMSKDRSRGFLKTLSELPTFDEATGWQYWRQDADVDDGRVRDSGRMTNRELALRFCAFRDYSDEDYRQYSSLDAFLVDYTRRLDGCSETGKAITDRDMSTIKTDFKRAMENAYKILEKAAFRRWPLGQNRRGPINRAVFESQAIALADYSLDQLLPNKVNIVTAFRGAFEDQEYARAVTVGTGAPAAVETRLKRTKEMLAEAIK
ncbi:MAG: DUF262 domain-containing protein [Candidatus Accumulibacter sp.]|uniref:DUF262 domain-containing protein n=1 Tax=Candidatus Accumulibacter affinis TaxID=2954384 RepID=A0A935TD28_9PROT|nr:DUF262 domain-containing protein [Candidatus Accumulibacter affinis]MBP9804770.1 DUF262 domain-containing protein [Accumulibacter sp.]